MIKYIDLSFILLLAWVIFEVTKDEDSFLHGQAGASLWAFWGIIYASLRIVCIFLGWSIPIIKEAIYQFHQLSGR